MRNARSGFGSGLAALLLLGVPALHAQGRGPAAQASFEELRQGLARAMDFQLEQARETARRAVRLSSPQAALETAQPKPASLLPEAKPARRGPAGASLEQVNAARERLRALGVDAAHIFAEEGVPLELLQVAAVESNFNRLALSPKGARGVWQLMPETAARYGLRVDRRVDERVHPARSTRAAARYLRELYLEFGDWLLALAAYNAGEARVTAAVEHAGTRDFWQLAAQGLLPGETRRYVPAVLAAMQQQ